MHIYYLVMMLCLFLDVISFMHVNVLSTITYLGHMHAWCQWRSEKGIKSSETVVLGNNEFPYQSWVSSLVIYKKKCYKYLSNFSNLNCVLFKYFISGVKWYNYLSGVGIRTFLVPVNISVLVLSCFYDKYLDQKQSGGKKVLFGLHFKVTDHCWWKSG